MSFKKLMPLVMLIAIIVIGAAFLPQILGTVDAGQSTNISQEYKDQLNSTKDVSIVTISLSRWVAPILGVVALVIAISAIPMKSGKRRY